MAISADQPLTHSAAIGATEDGMRLDQAAAQLFPDYSRARLQEWIKTGCLRLGGRQARAKDKVYLGDVLELTAQLLPEQAWQPEHIELNVCYQDEHIAVINKPPGLVTHPGAGNTHGTLANGLLQRFPALETLPRAGIVHRLDKDTSGLLVVALSLKAHNSLVQQLQERSVKRQYLALVWGEPAPSGVVDRPIGRHPQQRQKMAVRESGGKPAVTHYRRLESFARWSLLQLNLETGRTHQIRVHMAELGFPLLGDPVYGRRRQLPKDTPAGVREALVQLGRQALHAERLELSHPDSHQRLCWQAELPADMQQLLAQLRA